jgi:signal-transduction protein with cAMP-binding, CBS, and nucleotidyltransferase domain
MTASPSTVDESSTITEAAKIMKSEGIGDVIVMQRDEVSGILTDRDIVTRVIAEGKDPNSCTAGECCTVELEITSPDSAIEDVVSTMRSSAIRRIPVVEDGTLVGVISIGDLAIERDRRSALADISAAPSSD